jgi:hypothetical protein
LSTPSEQLVSVEAFAGTGVQAAPATQLPDEQTPAPPVRVQARPLQFASAEQFDWHAVVIETKVTVAVAVPADAVIATVAVPEQLAQVTSETFPLAALVVRVVTPVVAPDESVPRSVVMVALPPPVLVYERVTVLEPFATTDATVALIPTNGAGVEDEGPDLLSEQPPSASTANAAASVQTRPIMWKSSRGPAERLTRVRHVPGLCGERQDACPPDGQAGAAPMWAIRAMGG